MSNWNIELNKYVVSYILEQDIISQAEINQSLKLLSEFGITLSMPYVKPLGNKLYELRVKTKDKNHRLLYFSYIDKKFIFTNAFTKKTQKTPKNEIDIALKRMKIYRGENEK